MISWPAGQANTASLSHFTHSLFAFNAISPSQMRRGLVTPAAHCYAVVAELVDAQR